MEEIKLLVSLLVSLFYTLEPRLQVGTWLKRVSSWGSGIIYFSQFLGSLSFFPFQTLGIYSYKGFLSQVAKTLCLSEIATEAPFPSTESQGCPSSCTILACDLGAPDDLTGPCSGLLSQ